MMRKIKLFCLLMTLLCFVKITQAENCSLFSAIGSKHCVIATITYSEQEISGLTVDSLIYGDSTTPKTIAVAFIDSLWENKKLNASLGSKYLLFVDKFGDDIVYMSFCDNQYYAIKDNKIEYENQTWPKNMFVSAICDLKQNIDSIIHYIEQQDTSSELVQAFAKRSQLHTLLVQKMILEYLPCPGSSQIDESTPQQNYNQFAISPSKMNVLYIGVDNPLQIVVSGHKQYYVSSDNGEIYKKGDIFYARVKKPSLCRITIYLKPNKQAPFFIHEFRVKRIPDPIACIRNKRGGIVTKNFFSKANCLDLVMHNFDFDLQFSVVSYSVCITKADSTKTVFKTQSNNFTNEMIEAFKNLEQSDEVWFYNIIASAGNNIREIGPLVYRIDSEAWE